MIRRNPTFSKLKGSYLFPEIEKRKAAYLSSHPGAELLNFGIGDTTLPLPKVVAEAMARRALEMGGIDSYAGYGPSEGLLELRTSVVRAFYDASFTEEEVFISDGAKSEIGRLQLLLGQGLRVAVQDPVYPVFVDANILSGTRDMVLLPCLPENGFFPDLKPAVGCDVIYFCSPHNPTGVACSFEQLETLVSFAKENGLLIIYDSAYASFVSQGGFPRSIYEVPGAKEVAIEVGSFSKLAGFTGVRLGWTVVPKELQYVDGGAILPDFRRLIHTVFNGPSRISQEGGLAALTREGMQGIEKNITTYLENASLIKRGMEAMGAKVYGGKASPYVWALFEGRRSWDLFEELLNDFQMVTIPGRGFGPSGEGFVRLSSFCMREDALKIGRIILNN